MTVLCVAGTEKSGALEYKELGKNQPWAADLGHSFRHQLKRKGEQKKAVKITACLRCQDLGGAVSRK